MEQLEPDVDEMGWGAWERCYNLVSPILSPSLENPHRTGLRVKIGALSRVSALRRRAGWWRNTRNARLLTPSGAERDILV